MEACLYIYMKRLANGITDGNKWLILKQRDFNTS